MLVNKKIYNPLYFQLSGNASDTFFFGVFSYRFIHIVPFTYARKVENFEEYSGFQIFENNVRKDHLNIAKEIFQHLI